MCFLCYGAVIDVEVFLAVVQCSFVPNHQKDLTQGCKPQSAFSKCSASKFLHLTGYDYIYNQYTTPFKMKMADCNAKSLKTSPV